VYEIQEKEAEGEVDLVSHDAPINTVRSVYIFNILKILF